MQPVAGAEEGDRFGAHVTLMRAVFARVARKGFFYYILSVQIKIVYMGWQKSFGCLALGPKRSHPIFNCNCRGLGAVIKKKESIYF